MLSITFTIVYLLEKKLSHSILNSIYIYIYDDNDGRCTRHILYWLFKQTWIDSETEYFDEFH